MRKINKHIFVIQKHYSKKLHYDFRLEKDGFLKSWALPKDFPQERGVKRLAIQVPDHPLEFANFEGEISDGHYGAGKIEIWDTGTYTLELWQPKRIIVFLSGDKVMGKFEILKFDKEGKNVWLIIRV